VDSLGAQVDLDEPPDRVALRPDLEVLAERRQHAPGKSAATAGRGGLAHDLPEGAGVQSA
jgi:hypothetical protein